MSEHRTCNLDGCQFTAHEKIIEKHIRMQHSTGLYEKIRKLNTPEEISKWIQERKKNYPSKENVEKRYKQQEILLKKGIRLKKNENKFGKDRFRLTSKRPAPLSNNCSPKKKRKIKPLPKISLIDDKADWNGNMFPFRGTSELFKSEVVEEENKSDYEDDEWQSHSGIKKIKINNSLGSLMAAYGSDSDVEEKEVLNKEKVLAMDSDGEPPEEVKNIKQEPQESEVIKLNPPSTSRATDSESKRKRFHHKITKNRKTNRGKGSRAITTKKPLDNFPHNNFRRRKVTLLEKLLQSEIRHERNLLLQCVRYVVDNGFFRNE